MSENVPPTTSTTNQQPSTSTSTTDQPGRPYYESLRTTLRQTLDKKRKLDDQLSALEEKIFKMESVYLEETSGSGNIVRGFDGWVKGVSLNAGGGRGDGVGGMAGRKGRVRDEERVFSRGSVGWMRAQEGGGSESATPSHAATPTGSFAPATAGISSARESTVGTPKDGGAGGGGGTKNKKKRSAAVDKDGGEDEEKGNKRGKVSYSRE